MDTVAQRAFTSRPTLQRIERGDPSVGMGIYAGVLHALGWLDALKDLAAPQRDEVGLAKMEEALPKRARPNPSNAARSRSEGEADEG